MALRAKTKVAKEEGILPQNCNMEILPAFSSCWLALDFGLPHKPSQSHESTQTER